MSQLMKGIRIVISIKCSGIMKLTSELVNLKKKKNLYKCVCMAHRYGLQLMYCIFFRVSRVTSDAGRRGADGNEAGARTFLFLSLGVKM